MIPVKEKIGTFKDKKILVVGLARSGIGAANFLSLLGAKVTITDKRSGDALAENVKKLTPGIDVVTDDNPKELFEMSDMIVVSPGVPLNIESLQHARAGGIPIIGELELAYQTVAGSRLQIADEVLNEKSGICNTEPATPHFIGVTGTNGKSTVTTLVDLMLKESGCKTVLGGNIGNALTEELLKAGKHKEQTPDYIVAEISSFQLESINEFRPKVASILNITPDHLDRYESLSDYIEAKTRIFENQTSDDYLVLNADDPVLMNMMRAGKNALPRVAYFSAQKEVEGIYVKDGALFCNIPYPEFDCSNLPLISVDDIRIKGVHNLENAMAASLISIVAGCSQEAVKKVLRNFRGLEHRLEPVDVINGVTFINDSKGTNVGAVAKSLESFENVILIMGGLDKGSDFSVLKEQVREKVKHLILLGSAKKKIAGALGDVIDAEMVNGLKEAVELSVSRASEGDTVLLSPGCSSFDMFEDFEDRGRKFKEAVRELSR